MKKSRILDEVHETAIGLARIDAIEHKGLDALAKADARPVGLLSTRSGRWTFPKAALQNAESSRSVACQRASESICGVPMGESNPYMHIFLDAGNRSVLALFELPAKAPTGRTANTTDCPGYLYGSTRRRHHGLDEAKAVLAS